MSKIHCDTNGDITVPSTTPFVYRRPRCAVQHLIQRVSVRSVARIVAQVLTSASLIAGGIIVAQAGLNPIGAFGAFLALTGVGLVFGQEDTQTPEEYRQFVIEHFEERGETPPRWTKIVKLGQVWRHRGLLSHISKRHYKVISLDAGVVRCLVLDTDGKPIMADGKAQTCFVLTFTMRYAYKLVGGAS